MKLNPFPAMIRVIKQCVRVFLCIDTDDDKKETVVHSGLYTTLPRSTQESVGSQAKQQTDLSSQHFAQAGSGNRGMYIFGCKPSKKPKGRYQALNLSDIRDTAKMGQ